MPVIGRRDSRWQGRAILERMIKEHSLRRWYLNKTWRKRDKEKNSQIRATAFAKAVKQLVNISLG